MVGDCPTGADSMALRWAKDKGYHGRVYLATGPWPAAGPKRNQRMVDANRDAKAAVSFFKTGEKNAGTKDCVRRLADAGIDAMAVWS